MRYRHLRAPIGLTRDIERGWFAAHRVRRRAAEQHAAKRELLPAIRTLESGVSGAILRRELPLGGRERTVLDVASIEKIDDGTGHAESLATDRSI